MSNELKRRRKKRKYSDLSDWEKRVKNFDGSTNKTASVTAFYIDDVGLDYDIFEHQNKGD